MAIDNNPGGGDLSGTSPVATSAGIATFEDLSIDEPGDGYTLVASATGFGSVTSSSFNIAGLVQQCEAERRLHGKPLRGRHRCDRERLRRPVGPVLTMSLTPGGIDCDGLRRSSPAP